MGASSFRSQMAVVMLCAAFILSPALADDDVELLPDALLQSLSHDWSGEGEVRGMHAQVTLSFVPILEGQGYRLSFSNLMTLEGGGQWHFAAEAIYLCGGQPNCQGHWYDNRGVTLPLVARVDDGSLLVEWGDDRSERGRTRYALDGDQLNIIDEVIDGDGNYRQFGQLRASRN